MSTQQAYVDKVKAQLEQWAADLKKLKAKADEFEAETRVQAQKRIEDLEAKQKAARARLVELETAGADAFDDLRDGFESAWTNLKSAMSSAAERFK